MSKKFAPALKSVMQCHSKLGYNLTVGILNSRDFGLPQDRKRVFLIGVRTDCEKHKFTWPAKHPH
eukprot:4686586-Pyramimonas_sp.AAC.1